MTKKQAHNIQAFKHPSIQTDGAIITDKEKIEELLTRGVDEAIEEEHLRKALLSGKQLRIKFGIDPTASDLHLGHVVVLRKLKQFQDLGHQVIFLIGDFTAMIGDPSGRSETRKMLTEKEIKENMKDYIRQAGKILDFGKIEVRYNNEWYKKKGAMFLFELTSSVTIARAMERDDFKKRMKDDIDVSVLELIYPLMQGYDSVELKADVELGGRDQKFNLLMGRRVQRRYNVPEQDIMTVPLLEGMDGVKKMSKTYGNYIGLDEKPSEVYGKVMSVPDELMWKYYNLLSDVPLVEIKKMKEDIRFNELNPRDVKAKLAKEIVEMLHNEKEADRAGKEFDKVFKNKERPTEIQEVQVTSNNPPALSAGRQGGEAGKQVTNLLVELGLVLSKTEARRMVEQGGVKIDDKKIDDWKKEIKISNGMVVSVGKRRFARVRVNTIVNKSE